MTRDDIIRMAQKSGWDIPVALDDSEGFLHRLERFSATRRAIVRAAAEIGRAM